LLKIETSAAALMTGAAKARKAVFLAHERFVVHGHTPVSVLDLRPNRINIDTGAFATGRLACVVIEGSAIIQLPV
jgi:hypothetical protein